MPIHDWSRVEANTFHGFHLAWTGALRNALNQGLLPPGYYADAEQSIPPVAPDVLTLADSDAARPAPTRPDVAGTRMTGTLRRRLRPKPKTVSVRTAGNDKIVAMIEIVSNSNKDRRDRIHEYAAKVAGCLEYGVHFLTIDLLPPGRSNPQGMHAPVWRYFSRRPYALPAGNPLTVATYMADSPDVTAYVQHPAVGDAVPDASLFLTPDYAVTVPLARTYGESWAGTPLKFRDILEAAAP